MADRYWVGGTNTWNTSNTANWSTTSGGAGGASVPTSADSVFFSLATTYTVTLSGALNCLSFTVSAGTVTFGGTGTLSVAGSLTLNSTTTWTASGTVTFTATSPQTIATQGRTMAAGILFNGAGGSWTLTTSFVGTSSAGITINAGSVSSNFTISVPTIQTSGALTRSLTLGSNTVTLSGAIAVNFSGSGFTFTAGTSTISCSSANASILGNGVTFSTVILSSSAISTASLSGANTYGTLTIQGRSAVGLSRIQLSDNQTISGTLSIGSGASVPSRTMIRSDTIGVTRTLTVAAFAATADLDWQDITVTGAAAPISGTRFGNCRGNSGITFPAAKTVYYRNSGTTSQNWGTTGSGSWAASVGGAFDATQFPLAQDTAVIPATLYPGATGTIAINAPYNIGTIDMSARTTDSLTLSTATQAPFVYGNWLNGTVTTLSGTGIITFAGRGSQTITSAGQAFTQPITVYSNGGSVTLQDAFTSTNISSSALLITAGTFDANGFNVTMGGGGVAINSGTFTKTAAIGSGTWSLGNAIPWNALSATNFTVTGTGTISIISSLACTFYGNSQTYPKLNQGGAGTLTIDGSNTFSEISNTVIGNITFTASTTTTVSAFTVSGNATTRVQLRSTVLGTRFTLSDSSGTVTVTYLDIRDSNATGGAVWNAGSTSLDSGNNLGWIFSSVVASTGNMFLMFS